MSAVLVVIIGITIAVVSVNAYKNFERGKPFMQWIFPASLLSVGFGVMIARLIMEAK